MAEQAAAQARRDAREKAERLAREATQAFETHGNNVRNGAPKSTTDASLVTANEKLHAAQLAMNDYLRLVEDGDGEKTFKQIVDGLESQEAQGSLEDLVIEELTGTGETAVNGTEVEQAFWQAVEDQQTLDDAKKTGDTAGVEAAQTSLATSSGNLYTALQKEFGETLAREYLNNFEDPPAGGPANYPAGLGAAQAQLNGVTHGGEGEVTLYNPDDLQAAMAAMKEKYKDLGLDSAIGDVSLVIELGREVSLTDSNLPMEQRISQAAAKLLVDKAASPELREKLTLDQEMHDELKNDPSRNFEFQIYEKNPELYVLLKLKGIEIITNDQGVTQVHHADGTKVAVRPEDGTPLNLGISLLDPKQDGQTGLSPIADTIRLAAADRRVEYFTDAIEKAGEGLTTPEGTEDIQQWINDLREGKDTPAVEVLDLLNRGLNASLSGYEYHAITQAGNTVFTPEFFRAQLEALTHKPDTRDIPETPLETQAHNDSALPADKVGLYLQNMAENAPPEVASTLLRTVMEEYGDSWSRATKPAYSSGTNDYYGFYEGVEALYGRLYSDDPLRTEFVDWFTDDDQIHILHNLRDSTGAGFPGLSDAIEGAKSADLANAVLKRSETQDNLRWLESSMFEHAVERGASKINEGLNERIFEDFQDDPTRFTRPFFDGFLADDTPITDYQKVTDATKLNNLIGRALGLTPTDVDAAAAGDHTKEWFSNDDDLRRIRLIAAWIHEVGGDDPTLAALPYVYGSSRDGVETAALFRVKDGDGNEVWVDGGVANDVLASQPDIMDSNGQLTGDANLPWKYSSFENFQDDNRLSDEGDLYIPKDMTLQRGDDGHVLTTREDPAHWSTKEKWLFAADIAVTAISIAGAGFTGGASLGLLAVRGGALAARALWISRAANYGGLLYGAGRMGHQWHVMNSHGQNMGWSNPEARNLYIGAGAMAAGGVAVHGMHKINFHYPAANAGRVQQGLPEIQPSTALTTGTQASGVLAMTGGGYLVAEQTGALIQNWGNMTGSERLEGLGNAAMGVIPFATGAASNRIASAYANRHLPSAGDGPAPYSRHPTGDDGDPPPVNGPERTFDGTPENGSPATPRIADSDGNPPPRTVTDIPADRTVPVTGQHPAGVPVTRPIADRQGGTPVRTAAYDYEQTTSSTSSLRPGEGGETSNDKRSAIQYYSREGDTARQGSLRDAAAIRSLSESTQAAGKALPESTGRQHSAFQALDQKVRQLLGIRSDRPAASERVVMLDDSAFNALAAEHIKNGGAEMKGVKPEMIRGLTQFDENGNPSRIVLRAGDSSPAARSVAVHELVHFYMNGKFSEMAGRLGTDQSGFSLHEGVADFLAFALDGAANGKSYDSYAAYHADMLAQGGPLPSKYMAEAAVVERVVNTMGREAALKAIFDGDPAAIRNFQALALKEPGVVKLDAAHHQGAPAFAIRPGGGQPSRKGAADQAKSQDRVTPVSALKSGQDSGGRPSLAAGRQPAGELPAAATTPNRVFVVDGSGDTFVRRTTPQPGSRQDPVGPPTNRTNVVDSSGTISRVPDLALQAGRQPTGELPAAATSPNRVFVVDGSGDTFVRRTTPLPGSRQDPVGPPTNRLNIVDSNGTVSRVTTLALGAGRQPVAALPAAKSGPDRVIMVDRTGDAFVRRTTPQPGSRQEPVGPPSNRVNAVDSNGTITRRPSLAIEAPRQPMAALPAAPVKPNRVFVADSSGDVFVRRSTPLPGSRQDPTGGRPTHINVVAENGTVTRTLRPVEGVEPSRRPGRFEAWLTRKFSRSQDVTQDADGKRLPSGPQKDPEAIRTEAQSLRTEAEGLRIETNAQRNEIARRNQEVQTRATEAQRREQQAATLDSAREIARTQATRLAWGRDGKIHARWQAWRARHDVRATRSEVKALASEIAREAMTLAMNRYQHIRFEKGKVPPIAEILSKEALDTAVKTVLERRTRAGRETLDPRQITLAGNQARKAVARTLGSRPIRSIYRDGGDLAPQNNRDIIDRAANQAGRTTGRLLNKVLREARREMGAKIRMREIALEGGRAKMIELTWAEAERRVLDTPSDGQGTGNKVMNAQELAAWRGARDASRVKGVNDEARATARKEVQEAFNDRMLTYGALRSASPMSVPASRLKRTFSHNARFQHGVAKEAAKPVRSEFETEITALARTILDRAADPAAKATLDAADGRTKNDKPIQVRERLKGNTWSAEARKSAAGVRSETSEPVRQQAEALFTQRSRDLSEDDTAALRRQIDIAARIAETALTETMLRGGMRTALRELALKGQLTDFQRQTAIRSVAFEARPRIRKITETLAKSAERTVLRSPSDRSEIDLAAQGGVLRARTGAREISDRDAAGEDVQGIVHEAILRTAREQVTLPNPNGSRSMKYREATANGFVETFMRKVNYTRESYRELWEAMPADVRKDMPEPGNFNPDDMTLMVAEVPVGLESIVADIHAHSMGYDRRHGTHFQNLLSRSGQFSRVLFGSIPQHCGGDGHYSTGAPSVATVRHAKELDIRVVKDLIETYKTDPDRAAKADVSLTGLDFSTRGNPFTKQGKQNPLEYAIDMMLDNPEIFVSIGEVTGIKELVTQALGPNGWTVETSQKFRDYITKISQDSGQVVLLHNDWGRHGFTAAGRAGAAKQQYEHLDPLIEFFSDPALRGVNIVFAHTGVGRMARPGDAMSTRRFEILRWDFENNRAQLDPNGTPLKDVFEVTAPEHVLKIYELFEAVPNARVDISWNDVTQAFNDLIKAGGDEGKAVINMFLRFQDRILFGSDTVKPVNTGHYNQALTTGSVLFAEIARRNPDALWNILRGNYETLMKNAYERGHDWTRAKLQERIAELEQEQATGAHLLVGEAGAARAMQLGAQLKKYRANLAKLDDPNRMMADLHKRRETMLSQAHAAFDDWKGALTAGDQLVRNLRDALLADSSAELVGLRAKLADVEYASDILMTVRSYRAGMLEQQHGRLDALVTATVPHLATHVRTPPETGVFPALYQTLGPSSPHPHGAGRIGAGTAGGRNNDSWVRRAAAYGGTAGALGGAGWLIHDAGPDAAAAVPQGAMPDGDIANAAAFLIRGLMMGGRANYTDKIRLDGELIVEEGVVTRASLDRAIGRIVKQARKYGVPPETLFRISAATEQFWANYQYLRDLPLDPARGWTSTQRFHALMAKVGEWQISVDRELGFQAASITALDPRTRAGKTYRSVALATYALNDVIGTLWAADFIQNIDKMDWSNPQALSELSFRVLFLLGNGLLTVREAASLGGGFAKITNPEANRILKLAQRWGTGALAAGGAAWTAHDGLALVDAIGSGDSAKIIEYLAKTALDGFFTWGAARGWLNEYRKANGSSMKSPFLQNAPQTVIAGALVLREILELGRPTD